MTNPNDTLNTLWEMSEQGKAEWWPDELKYGKCSIGGGYGFFYRGISMSTQHALDLVAASCERGLAEKGMEICHDTYGKVYQWWERDAICKLDTKSLPEAIEYAAKQQTQS